MRNKGGHSSLPVADNAIYRLSEGLVRMGKYAFPVNLNETTRTFLQRAAAFEDAKTGADMKSVASDTPDPAAVARLSAIPRFNSAASAPPASRRCSKAATR